MSYSPSEVTDPSHFVYSTHGILFVHLWPVSRIGSFYFSTSQQKIKEFISNSHILEQKLGKLTELNGFDISKENMNHVKVF